MTYDNWHLTFNIQHLICTGSLHLTFEILLLTFEFTFWWYIVKISYSLIYYESIGIGTDGTCTGTDDTGMSFDGTVRGTECTDSTSTDAYDSGTILSHFHSNQRF